MLKSDQQLLYPRTTYTDIHRHPQTSPDVEAWTSGSWIWLQLLCFPNDATDLVNIATGSSKKTKQSFGIVQQALAWRAGRLFG
jgi:hypothetical protein